MIILFLGVYYNNVCEISALVSAIVFNVCAALNYRH